MSSLKKFHLKKELKNMPLNPGVYLMQNKAQKVIYIGKAKALRSRVLSYFNSQKTGLKNQFLKTQIHSVDYIVTDNEVEAFLLEASLIKKHRPRYNIRLKDDKAYPYIRCSVKDSYPRLYFERKVQDRRSLYFGPYTQGGSVRHIMDFVNQNFQIRDCSDKDFKTRQRPCLSHQMGNCTAPCVQLVSQKQYKDQFQRAIRFLRGHFKNLKKELHLKMNEAALKLQFEQAGRLRDSLKALEMLEQSQSIISKHLNDVDAVALTGDERGLLIETLHARGGRVIGNRHQFLKDTPTSSEILLSFLNQYYEENLIPDEILISFPLKKSLLKLMQAAFSKRKGSPCKVFSSSEEESALLKMAKKNAEHHFQYEVDREENQKEILFEIQKKFRLQKLPLRMECYDISHWQGKQSVGSQAVFENGIPLKKDYRLYSLKTQSEQDDFKSLYEVLSRRLKHREYKLPDLILIDGGKGQLRAALKALTDLKKGHIPVVSLAKDRVKKTALKKSRTKVFSSGERFYLPGRKNPVLFRSNTGTLRLLLHLRDEAHRFAIESHRKKRNKTFLKGSLDTIDGLGPKRKQALLKHFKSLSNIKKATEKEIAKAPGIPKQLAKKIKQHFASSI